MTSKYPNQSSRRYPLKRVRPANENQGLIISTNERINKKFCRQPAEDSAFVEIEKSSDERAYDLFNKEYFCQFRSYFKHRSIALQFLEHLWSNMIESSKVAFVKKILKEQGIYDMSTNSVNDENDAQLSKSFNESNRNLLTLNSNNKYSRSFINEFLSYLKHWITPRFIDKSSSSSSSSSKLITPLRRSSRIRRAPIKCVCSTCVTTGVNEEHLTSNDDLQNQIFRELINHYHQLDDEYVDRSNSPLLINDNNQTKLDETNDSQIQMALSEVTETETRVPSSPPIIPMLPVISNDIPVPSFDLLINPNDKIPLVMSDSFSTSPCPIRRTFVILTELDEPFFGPYPIEFTITI